MRVDHARNHRFGRCVAILTLAAPLQLAAFETTSSYTIFGGLDRGISSNLNVGLISSSFSDMFSRIEISSTQVEVRLLEGRQRVDATEVRRYVDERYAALPEAERATLSDKLVQARQADEDLKVRMADPRLSDDIKLMFAQERERLRSAVFLYEQRVQAAYLPYAKPKATGELEDWLRYFSVYLNDAAACDFGTKHPTCPDLPSGSSALAHLFGEQESRSRQLLLAPTEVPQLGQRALASFVEKANEHIRNLSAYISRLYSPAR